MSPEQRFLLTIQRTGTPWRADGDGTWYVVVGGDPDEFGGQRTTIGHLVKIGGEPGHLTVLGHDTYNR